MLGLLCLGRRLLSVIEHEISSKLRRESHPLPDSLVQLYDLSRLMGYFDHDRVTLLGYKTSRPLPFAADHEVVAISVTIDISLERK